MNISVRIRAFGGVDLTRVATSQRQVRKIHKRNHFLGSQRHKVIGAERIARNRNWNTMTQQFTTRTHKELASIRLEMPKKTLDFAQASAGINETKPMGLSQTRSSSFSRDMNREGFNSRLIRFQKGTRKG